MELKLVLIQNKEVWDLLPLLGSLDLGSLAVLMI